MAKSDSANQASNPSGDASDLNSPLNIDSVQYHFFTDSDDVIGRVAFSEYVISRIEKSETLYQALDLDKITSSDVNTYRSLSADITENAYRQRIAAEMKKERDRIWRKSYEKSIEKHLAEVRHSSKSDFDELRSQLQMAASDLLRNVSWSKQFALALAVSVVTPFVLALFLWMANAAGVGIVFTPSPT